MEVAILPRRSPTLFERLGLDGEWSQRVPQLLVYALLVAVVFLVSYPVIMLLLGSFSPPRGTTGVLFSLEGYRTAFTDGDARRAMTTSLWLATTQAFLAASLAIFLAWSLTRTNVPGRRIFHTLLIINFFLPALPRLLAWTMLLAPNAGIFNVFLRSTLGLDGTSGPFNIYSYQGIMFVNVLNWAGFLYLLISPAFQSMDASLEESAKMSGANSFTLLRRITVPILKPAILGGLTLAFIRMVESFETELLLGTPAHIYVFTTQIYYYLTQAQVPNYPPAIALAVVLIVLAGIVITLQKKLLGSRSYVTITGKNFRSTPTDLGRWKYVLLAVLLVFFTIDILIPAVTLIAGSFQRSTAMFRMDGWSLEHWAVLLEPDLRNTLVNTLLVAVVAATVAISVITLISYIVHRTAFRGRSILDFATWMPYLLPGFVLSLGFLWAVLKGIPLPWSLYGTLQLLMIVFAIRLLPSGSRLMGGTMVQLSKELEEAAFMSGANLWQTLRKVVLPLLMPSIIMAWLIFMIMVMRDFSMVILLYGPKSNMLSIAFYSYWQGGNLEDAAVIGLLMTIIGGILVAGVTVMRRVTRVGDERLM